MTSKTDTTISIILLFAVAMTMAITLSLEIVHLGNRIDDLEARITTLETIRIEYVAPSKDSG